MSDGPQIQIDDDWKAQAQAEKQRLSKRANEQAGASPPGTSDTATGSSAPSASAPGAAANGAPNDLPVTDLPPDDETPPVDFQALVSTIASQAMLYLGMLPDPMSGQRIVGFEHARQQMGLLEVLEEKTDGNLDDEEKTMLASMLYRLRNQYVQVVMQMRPLPDHE